MGFDVARSTIQGNAKASISGTSDGEIQRLPFNLKYWCLLLWGFGSGQERIDMDYKKAEELRKEWGDKPCSHPHLEPETHLGSEFVAVKTGDYVCTICGQDFTQEERNQIVAARDSQK